MISRSQFQMAGHHLLSLVLFFPGMIAAMVYVPPLHLQWSSFVRSLFGWPMPNNRQFAVLFWMMVCITLWGMFMSWVVDGVMAWYQSRRIPSPSKSAET